MTEVISKKIGVVGSVSVHLVLIEGQEEPIAVFADKKDENVPLMALNLRALRNLIRTLHLLEAEINAYMEAKDE